MNFDRYAAELEKHNDRLLEELNSAKKAEAEAQAQFQATAGRPFQRTHKPAASASNVDPIATRMQHNRKQSALFPGVDPSLARFGFED